MQIYLIYWGKLSLRREIHIIRRNFYILRRKLKNKYNASYFFI